MFLLILLISIAANAKEQFVDQSGSALYDTMEGCQKYHSVCYKTDSEFSKEYYELKGGEYVKNPQLEQNVKAAKKAKEDLALAEIEEIKTILNKSELSVSELSKAIKFILKEFDKK